MNDDKKYEEITTILAECRDTLHRVEDLMRSCRERTSPEISSVKRLVCQRYGVSLKQMDSPGRVAYVAWARQVAMYLCRFVVGASLREIAAAFNKKDHVTVLYACHQVEDRISTSPKDATKIEGLRSEITKNIAIAV